MQFTSEFLRCLVDLDAAGARKIWAYTHPHLHQPATDHETLLMLHSARTQTELVSLKSRAYSHRWLVDNGYPSALPDHLKPEAERIYPRVAEAVGLAVASKSSYMKPAALEIRSAMEGAVLEAVADRIRLTDSRVSVMIRAAREKIIKKLFG